MPSMPSPLHSPLPAVLAAGALALSLTGCTGDNPSALGTDGGVAGGTVTYHKDIEPLVQQHCQGCHMPGRIAPFALTSYAEARGAAGLMVSVTHARTMPPWGATSTADCKPRFGWKGDPRLTDDQIALFQKWVDAGAPEGDPKDAPPPFTPPPDGLSGVQRELQPKVPFVTGGTRDQYQCFVIDPALAQATYLNGWHFVAGNPKVVHHALMFITADKAAADEARRRGGASSSYECFGGPGLNTRLVSAWAPGAQPQELPPDVATTLPAGTLFVMQIHYHPGGLTNQSDSTRFQMRFLDSKPTWQLLTSLIGNFDRQLANGDGLQPDENGQVEFRIPANAGHKVIDQRFTLPELVPGLPLPELRLLAIGTHMHYVGRDMAISVERGPTITNGDPASECLLETPAWDFNWQRAYYYDTPLDSLPRLHTGDRLRMRCVYDNTMQNPFVADALRQQGLDQPRDVVLGEETLDEMCLGVFGTIFRN